MKVSDLIIVLQNQVKEKGDMHLKCYKVEHEDGGHAWWRYSAQQPMSGPKVKMNWKEFKNFVQTLKAKAEGAIK